MLYYTHSCNLQILCSKPKQSLLIELMGINYRYDTYTTALLNTTNHSYYNLLINIYHGEWAGKQMYLLVI